MSLYETTKIDKIFNQDNYNNVFYCCEDNHPFVAFTTCYCPMCECLKDYTAQYIENKRVEDALDECQEELGKLVMQAKKLAPEILV